MENNEIRRANRKALPKFLFMMVISLAVGGLIGYLAAKYGLNELTGKLQEAGMFFGSYIAPWLLLAMAVVLPCVCVPLYRSAGALLNHWDGENEDISGAADKKLSIALWISGAALILSYFLTAAAYSDGFHIFEDKQKTILFFVSIAAFFAVMIETLVIGQKCVDAVKRMSPEKKASVYDMKFQKKWEEDCDEAEKIMMGRCGFRAYSATNKTCAALAGILAICALIFNIGFLPSLAVCLVWIVNQTVYFREAMKYSRTGNRIS